MNRQQFDESMKRVLAFTQSPKTPSEIQHLQSYMNGLYEAIGDMDAYTFELVTVDLCKNMSRGQRPMPGQFRAIYRRIKDEQHAGKPAHVCGSCKNTLWTIVRMLESKSGEERDFAEPCPECQIHHPFKDAPPKEGWIRVDRSANTHEQNMLAHAKAMGPRGAKFILGMIEKGRVMFSDEVVLELAIRAAETPEQENKAAQTVLDKLTVVSGSPREAAPALPLAAVGSGGPQTVTVNGETYEVEE